MAGVAQNLVLLTSLTRLNIGGNEKMGNASVSTICAARMLQMQVLEIWRTGVEGKLRVISQLAAENNYFSCLHACCLVCAFYLLDFSYSRAKGCFSRHDSKLYYILVKDGEVNIRTENKNLNLGCWMLGF